MLAQITKWVHQGPLNSKVRSALNSTWSLMLASIVLGALGTLGFAPYHQWVLLLISLSFEIFVLMRLRCKKHVFCALLLYFTALNALTLEWLNFVMTGFGQLPLIASWLIELSFSAYLALFHALLGTLAFSLALKRLKPKVEAAAPATPQPAPTEAAAKPAETAAQSAAPEQSELTADDTDDDADDDDYDDADALPNRGVAALMDEPTPQGELTGGALPGWVPATAQVTGHNGPSAPGYPCFKLGSHEVRLYQNAFALCLLPLALILADFIIGWLFTGFPWMYLGYGLLDGPLAAYAPLLGVRGLSFILMIMAGALALTLERSYIYLPIAGMLFLIALFTQGLSFVKPLAPVTMVGVQGNIAQAIKWDPRNTLPTIDKYLNLTEPLLGHNDLIIWPESALPVFMAQVTPLMDDLNYHAYERHSPILVGIQRYEPPRTSFNSIYLLGQDLSLEAAQVYDKRALVPFGEIIPLEQHLRSLGPLFNFPMSSFTRGAHDQPQLSLKVYDHSAAPIAADATDGANAAVPAPDVAVPAADAAEAYRTLNFVPAICYESIFPELIAGMADISTHGIIMVSNDSWYGATRGPEEHLAIARMRALELQKPMMRVTNSGITAYIDAHGVLIKRLPQNVDGVLQVEFEPTQGQTPFGRWGNRPLLVLMVLTALAGLMLRRRTINSEQTNLSNLIRP